MKKENPFEKPSVPAKEEERLAKLLGYNVMDDYARSGTFKHVVGMAAYIFRVPIAFVNFVAEENILIKASVGIEGLGEVRREIGLCSLAVLRDEVTVFENARLEQRLATNPLVHGAFGLQFYAGAPIRTPDGIRIGVVAIADKQPRTFSREAEQMLEALAAIVMDELEARKALRNL
ncbi:GAF domain-containing protein [Pontibacter liquoris]|uniref:GAF domain-containing protein n=1 Tax=Pontibacter liquoris TaxID=2905677 RepID=UPI001FA709DC|nr:GAF domain-containing protein [Pontibacter liquoris]